MSAFTALVRSNRNYRSTWIGQVVSEVGDHFNNIAVMSLAMQHANPGLVVTGVFLARAVPMLAAGPIAGVLLDRLDRKRVMIASDLTRAVIAIAFILSIYRSSPLLLYLLSAALMFASPFFTAGRNSILPVIATPEELHAANTMTQTTSWASLTVGAFLGAVGTQYGFKVAFAFNALSFVISALCISRLKRPSGFKPAASERKRKESGLMQYRDGLRYMRSAPLVFGIAMLSMGWATGGGAAQILFSLFGEKVFNAGPMGIGVIWGFAGIGLLIGGSIAYWLGKRLSFVQYKRTIAIAYVIHGGSYIVFSQMPTIAWACVFITLSRAAIAVSAVLNFSQLLRHVEDQYRGRVFATLESLQWSTMMLSMMAAGAASTAYSPRTIGAWAGAVTSLTAIFWTWANWTGRLPEPKLQPVLPIEEKEIHAEPQVTS
ncbi:MAG TPA: MFS transporter [Bryobacteraceae bacterium]|nr:MFS transporter [Bryobacteraceae bacterium]